MNNRNPILCEDCGCEMVFMKDKPIETVGELSAYAWYRCPTREGERGCGKMRCVELPTNARGL